MPNIIEMKKDMIPHTIEKMTSPFSFCIAPQIKPTMGKNKAIM